MKTARATIIITWTDSNIVRNNIVHFVSIFDINSNGSTFSECTNVYRLSSAPFKMICDPLTYYTSHFDLLLIHEYHAPSQSFGLHFHTRCLWGHNHDRSYKVSLVSDWPFSKPKKRQKLKTILIQMKVWTVSAFHILLTTVFKSSVSDILFGYS